MTISDAGRRLSERKEMMSASVANQLFGFLMETEGISLETAAQSIAAMADETNFVSFVALCMYCSRVSRNALVDKAQALLSQVGDVPTLYTTNGANFKALSVTGHLIFRILCEVDEEEGMVLKAQTAYRRGLGGNARHIGEVVADAAINDKKKKERNTILVAVRDLLSEYDSDNSTFSDLIKPLENAVNGAQAITAASEQKGKFGRITKTSRNV